jgi:hypothetical protein
MSGMDDFASSEECLTAVGVENADLLADCNGDPRLVLQQISLALKGRARRLKARALMGSLGREVHNFQLGSRCTRADLQWVADGMVQLKLAEQKLDHIAFGREVRGLASNASGDLGGGGSRGSSLA